MLIQYVGPHASQIIPAIGETVLRGESVEVPEPLAAGLLEQPDNWQPAKPAKGATPPEPVEEP